MKRIFLVLFAATLLLTGCGMGSRPADYRHHEDSALILLADRHYSVDVSVDHHRYRVSTVKRSEFRNKRHYDRVTDNMIVVHPGVHKVTVRRRGRVVLEQRTYFRPGDTKTLKISRERY